MHGDGRVFKEVCVRRFASLNRQWLDAEDAADAEAKADEAATLQARLEAERAARARAGYRGGAGDHHHGDDDDDDGGGGGGRKAGRHVDADEDEQEVRCHAPCRLPVRCVTARPRAGVMEDVSWRSPGEAGDGHVRTRRGAARRGRRAGWGGLDGRTQRRRDGRTRTLGDALARRIAARIESVRRVSTAIAWPAVPSQLAQTLARTRQ